MCWKKMMHFTHPLCTTNSEHIMIATYENRSKTTINEHRVRRKKEKQCNSYVHG